MIERETLSNGIRLIAEPMGGSFRSVSMGVWIGAGSVYEDESEAGASHLIEHMLFKGTEKRSAADIAAEMDGIGGNLNAFTAKECTCYYAKVLSDHTDKAVDLLHDIVCCSKIDDAELEKEKGVVAEEILMVEDTPEDLVHEELARLMFDGTPLSKPILGSEESVRAFTRDKLRAYLSKRYNADNIVISCAGRFELPTLKALLEKHFAGENGVTAAGMPGSRLLDAPRFFAVEKDVEQTHICIGFPGFEADSDGQFALHVLSNAFGGSMSSRLFQRIREERGLAYSVYSYPTSYSGTGYFTLYAGTGEKQAADVAALMLEEARRLAREGLTGEELERSREQLKGSYMLAQESTSARCNAIGKAELLRGKVYDEDELMARIERVGMDEIMEILPHVLDEGRMAAAVVGRSGADKLEKIILGG